MAYIPALALTAAWKFLTTGITHFGTPVPVAPRLVLVNLRGHMDRKENSNPTRLQCGMCGQIQLHVGVKNER